MPARGCRRHLAWAAGVLYLLLATPPARAWLEATMSAHMLAQIPLLAALGFVACRLLPERTQDALLDRAGGIVPCVLLATFASSYWMLPRALDEALARGAVEAAKFVSLPVLVGLPLALAWRRLGTLGRGFVWTNFFSMLAVLGWLYIAAPVRVCNSYLVDQQESTGWLMVWIAVLMFVGWLGSLFVGGKGNPASLQSSSSERDAVDTEPTGQAGGT
ncbi:MAG: hypothetical protein ROZ37_11465 [Aromatoleum sp.]|jgi:hypothetical protein|uniref:hypothetical protein n=1 Tax=Aromatoleum sp. TaxID=2307007 RepID=UPI002894161C|nr:hypothetical protein [Aromatoleum sp.]MDT3670934.1 hypothetical protein [Aromatoleum sp.]